MFEITNSLNSNFRFYRTPTSGISSTLRPQIRVVREVPYLLIPIENSFYIYKLEDLTLHFICPPIEGIGAMCFNEQDVIVCAQDRIYRIFRGEIVSIYSTTTNEYIKDTENLPSPDHEIIDVCRFGTYLVVLTSKNQLIVFEHAEEVRDPLDQIEAQGGWLDAPAVRPTNDKSVYITEVSRINLEERAIRIYHPYTYTNKLLVIYESGMMELYNIAKSRVIFTFDLKAGILDIGQTEVLDVLGILLNDGTVRVLNIKKDKVVFDITTYSKQAKSNGSNIIPSIRNSQVDFKDRYAMILIDGRMAVYDLELKREVFSKDGVLSALIVSKDVLLVSMADSVELYNVEDFTLLKKRWFLSGPVNRIVATSEREVLFIGPSKLFKMNVYKDEQNVYLKNKRNIEHVALGRNTLVYGERHLNYLNQDNGYYDFIDRKCDWIKTYDDFCFIGCGNRCLLMNIKSKRIVLDFRLQGTKKDAVVQGKKEDSPTEAKKSSSLFTYETNEIDPVILDGDFTIDKFTILTRTRIMTFSYKRALLFSFDTTAITICNEPPTYKLRASVPSSKPLSLPVNFNTIKIVGSLYFLHGGNNLAVLCNTTARTFKADRYSLEPTNKFIATVYESKLVLYDLVSGRIVEQISANIAIKDAVLLDNLKFIGVLDVNDHFHLLFNQSYLESSRTSFMTVKQGKSTLNISLAKKKTDIAQAIAAHKEFGTSTEDIVRALGRPEILELLQLIENNIADASAINVLSKILQYKSHLIDQADVARLYALVSKKWESSEDVLIKTLGYLELSQKHLL